MPDARLNGRNWARQGSADLGTPCALPLKLGSFSDPNLDSSQQLDRLRVRWLKEVHISSLFRSLPARSSCLKWLRGGTALSGSVATRFWESISVPH